MNARLQKMQKKIESDILSSFSFTFNTSENEDDTKPHIIYED